MSDWQVGDLALCVDDRLDGIFTHNLRKGCVYRVSAVCGGGISALHGPSSFFLLFEDASTDAFGFAPSRFRKIRPDEHESCEPEFVTLLKRSKQPAHAKETASEWLLRVGPIAKRLREESQEDGRPAQKALPVNK